MKLFTVSEPGDGFVTPGIHVDPNESPMGLRWGSANRDDLRLVPVCKPQYKAVRAAVDKGLVNNAHRLVLARADLIDTGDKGLRFELEKDDRDQRALIYVCTQTAASTQPVRGGPDDALHNNVTFTSGDPVRVVDGVGSYQRVRRVHPPFSETVGVRLVQSALISDSGATWNEALVVMVPGTSFRIVRGGDTRDMVPEFLVVWTGHRLRTVIPERYRPKPMEEMASA